MAELAIITIRINTEIGGLTITPRAISRFWHRRLCEAGFVLSATIVVVYIWGNLLGSGLPGLFSQAIDEISLILAALTTLASFVLYMWLPEKRLNLYSFSVYILLAITSASLIFGSGGVDSPFIFLWMILAVFAGVFGKPALIPMILAVVAYLAHIYLSNGSVDSNTLLASIFSGLLPLVVSYVLWHRQSDHESNKDRAYRDLANELSQVSGKSDIVISAIADGVIALDRNGVIELINPAAQQIIGWQRQDALKLSYKSVLKLIDNNDKELSEANDPIAQAIATNKPIKTNNLKLVTESGKKRLVSVVVSPVSGHGDGVIVVFRDITNEKAEERQQAEFISTASHEMRTPVASIEGYLGLALNPATATIDDKARDFITKAHMSAQHLGRLFQDLLDVSKAEDGRLANNPKVVNVVEYLKDVVEGLQSKANEKQLRLVYKPSPDRDEIQPVAHRSLGLRSNAGLDRTLQPVYYAHVDNDHLREVVANLTENAIKYTPSGDVIVDVAGDEEKITISVRDSGIGIPAEDIPHLFQKFYRVDNTETREIGGTGLGLYLCRRLAEAMSGRLWVKSEYKQGSTFYLEIPRLDHEEAMRLLESAPADDIDQPVEPQVAPPTAPPVEPQTMPVPQQPAPQQPATAPQPQPTYQPTTPQVAPIAYQPVQAQPLTQPAVRPAPQYQQPMPAQPTDNRRGPTLSSIEQNPGAYMTRPAQQTSINIPNRSQGPPNQT